MDNYLEVLRALQGLPQTQNNPIVPSAINPMEIPFASPSVQAPGLDPNAMAPPVAPSQPIDQSIVQQYLSMAGQAPVREEVPEPNALQKVANILLGISAGGQGRGPEFIQSLNAPKERSNRQFQQDTRDFENRKLQLALRGTEAAQTAEEKRQARTQLEADRKFEIEVNRVAKAAGLTDQIELEKLRDAMASKRQREDDERRAIENEKLELKQKQLKSADLAKAYRLAGAASFSKELADRDAGLTDKVSSAADKWLTNKVKLDEARANRAASGGGGGGSRGSGGSGKPEWFVELSNNQVVPANLIKMNELGGVQGFGDGVTIKRYFTTQQPGLGAPQQTPQVQGGFDQTNPNFQGPTTIPSSPMTAADIQDLRNRGLSEQFIKDEVKRRGIVSAPEPKRSNAAAKSPLLSTIQQRK
jgi:hypothetical protein